ncbi:hypothetical protein BACOVA_04675 [Bacteroides ovatus ATCC 8483]|uniref:Uncharacterized protein n=1 Tax=Bacteroides ovatus (strain ATCC 8483 / DSM 1896 / JCM 5824 / BCRC 10623 / CCUG 4943 / NCTC 11153) TaxID=411476 RepID=A0AAN3A173_BACO1|nr:hypothetical protein BACOVA_04675 [Bacteroides ovatus ATCC 8483]
MDCLYRCFEGNGYLCKKQCSLKETEICPFFFWLWLFIHR